MTLNNYITNSIEKSKERLDICNVCEFLNKEKVQCTKCGCFMKLKTVIPTAKCPIGKW